MNQLVQRLAGIVSNDIQVSGIPSQEFPESRWREAILFYLFGIWSNRQSVIYRPKIGFGDIILRLAPGDGEYYAYGTSNEELPTEHPVGERDDHLVVRSWKQADVEVALARFVKNDRIKWLTLSFRYSGRLVLWKKSRRGQYGITATDIPRSWGTCGPEW